MAPANPPARLVLLDPQSPDPFRPNVNVLAQSLGTMTPEEYLTLSRLQMKAMGESVAVELDEPLGTAGGHLFEFQAQVGGVQVRCRQLIVLFGGSAYVVTAMATPARFEQCRGRLTACLASVSLSVG
jgi:hypothetical protein